MEKNQKSGGKIFFNQKLNKKGQVTIFIIIGLVIIVFAVLIYMFYPKISSTFSFEEQNPDQYMQECLKDDLKEIIGKISSQGGSVNPSHYILYNNDKVEYLCYSERYYKQCVVQQPMLKNHIEEEIKKNIQGKITECLNSMEKEFESKGYEVTLQKGDTRIELLPEKIMVLSETSLILQKDGTQRYNSIRVVLNNNLYELVSIANSIINWETRYGDAETTVYMDYYQNIKVEKKKQSDGSTIYIITDRNTKDKLQFASRSIALPPGYGLNELLYENV